MQMLKGGYAGKVLRIDLSSKETRIEELKEPEVLKLMGGRGIAARMYYDEIDADVQPLGEANKIFFIAGPLTGVALPSTTKFQLATRSPETGMYLCSNCGGEFGPQLKMAGFDGLIIEGKADKWTYLTIKDGGEVGFGDAGGWVGLTSNETLAELRKAIGDEKASAISIGPAGERLVCLSYLNVDTRAFGRGGPGAVFGSKKLKGIALRGTGDIPVADRAKIDEIRKAAIKNLKETRANHTKYGTPQYIEPINELGCMPTRNFQTTHFEGSKSVDAHAMREKYFVKNYACYRCPIACGKVCEVREGPFAGARARTEFESVGLLGPGCGVADFAAIIKANEVCDDLGLDTISAANAVALAMELYERGLITGTTPKGSRPGSATARRWWI